jgi:hypothetical protein
MRYISTKSIFLNFVVTLALKTGDQAHPVSGIAPDEATATAEGNVAEAIPEVATPAEATPTNSGSKGQLETDRFARAVVPEPQGEVCEATDLTPSPEPPKAAEGKPAEDVTEVTTPTEAITKTGSKVAPEPKEEESEATDLSPSTDLLPKDQTQLANDEATSTGKCSEAEGVFLLSKKAYSVLLKKCLPEGKRVHSLDCAFIQLSAISGGEPSLKLQQGPCANCWNDLVHSASKLPVERQRKCLIDPTSAGCIISLKIEIENLKTCTGMKQVMTPSGATAWGGLSTTVLMIMACIMMII